MPDATGLSGGLAKRVTNTPEYASISLGTLGEAT
jgi:hypothetical protein